MRDLEQLLRTAEQIEQPSNVNDFVELGIGSKVWRFCNIYGSEDKPVIIGNNTQIGGNSEIKPGVIIGNDCRIQYGTFLPELTKLSDRVFLGPRVTFTNNKYPNAKDAINGNWVCSPTLVDSDVSIGAGAIILPGLYINKHILIGAGSVVTKCFNSYSIIAGNPAKKIGDVRELK
jgi:acetyltransferase-like isoleucine patch superfamily enzyme